MRKEITVEIVNIYTGECKTYNPVDLETVQTIFQIVDDINSMSLIGNEFEYTCKVHTYKG